MSGRCKWPFRRRSPRVSPGSACARSSADDRRRAALHVLDWAGLRDRRRRGGARPRARDLGAGRSRGTLPRDRRRPTHAVDRGARERRGRQRARDGRRAPHRDPASRAGSDSRGACRRRAPGRFERGVPRRGRARLRGDDPGGHGGRARALQVLAQHRDLRPVRRRSRGVLALRARGEGLDRRVRQRRHAGGRPVAGAARADHVEAAPQRPRRARRAARRRSRAYRLHRPDARSSKGRRASSPRCAPARTRTTSCASRSSAGSSTRRASSRGRPAGTRIRRSTPRSTCGATSTPGR